MYFDERRLQDSFSINRRSTMTDFYRVDDLFIELKKRENALCNLLSKAKKLTVDYKQSTGLKAYIKIVNEIKAELPPFLFSYKFLRELLHNLREGGIITCSSYDTAEMDKEIHEILSKVKKIEIEMVSWVITQQYAR